MVALSTSWDVNALTDFLDSIASNVFMIYVIVVAKK
jgi:hypothetical protein